MWDRNSATGTDKGSLTWHLLRSADAAFFSSGMSTRVKTPGRKRILGRDCSNEQLCLISLFPKVVYVSSIVVYREGIITLTFGCMHHVVEQLTPNGSSIVSQHPIPTPVKCADLPVFCRWWDIRRDKSHWNVFWGGIRFIRRSVLSSPGKKVVDCGSSHIWKMKNNKTANSYLKSTDYIWTFN